MISKEEAEEKLLKIFYDVKLDTFFKKNPTNAKIEEFEETKDLDDLDGWYGVKDDKLLIGMCANSYEHGIPFFAVIMAHGSAKYWREDPLGKHQFLYLLTQLILPFIIMSLVYFIRFYSLFGAILINILGTGIIFYFIILKINWKKRVLTRFRELFENTDISLSEEKINQYSKSRFPEIIAITILQSFIIFLFLFSWVMGFSEGI